VSTISSRTLRLTLVRHGESSWNLSRLVQGQDDRAQLTDEGKAQARRVVETLQEHTFQHVFTSDLVRARQTATIISDALHLSLEIDPLLRERSFGMFEGGPLSNLTADVTGIAKGVVENPDARPAGGESFRDVVRRAAFFLERVGDEPSSSELLIVTHGGTIRALRAYCSGAALEGLTWDPVGNCSIWSVEVAVSN